RAFFYRFTLLTRILLAAGFVPTGLVKLLGYRFTQMTIETPIGAFFEAMFQTGLYWRFLGASQMVAGLMLLVPATAPLGAALFLPIMINIAVITISIPFGGTPFVTVPMSLAVLYLCLWDFPRFRGLLTTAEPREPLAAPRPQALSTAERLGFWVFGVSLMAFFGFTRGFVPPPVAAGSVFTGVAGGLLALTAFALETWRRSRAQKLQSST
ncbi:MAG: hypothetical protein AAF725_18770, partial [Acidobacteriota bacterium]